MRHTIYGIGRNSRAASQPTRPWLCLAAVWRRVAPCLEHPSVQVYDCLSTSAPPPTPLQLITPSGGSLETSCAFQPHQRPTDRRSRTTHNPNPTSSETMRHRLVCLVEYAASTRSQGLTLINFHANNAHSRHFPRFFRAASWRLDSTSADTLFVAQEITRS